MGNLERLVADAAKHSTTLSTIGRRGGRLIIVTHLDADGQTAASILAKSLMRRYSRFQIKVLSDLTLADIESLKGEDYDYYVFTDLGSGFAAKMREYLAENWLVVDHHQTDESEFNFASVFNAWKFGYDGGLEVSSAGMAYLIATQMAPENTDLSWLAIVGALADRQDELPGRSLTGLNQRIANDGENSKVLRISKDLIFYGRETRPIHESIASSYSPFIPGITGNPEACLSILNAAGFTLKHNDAWRTISELTQDEKTKLIEALIMHSGSSGLSREFDELVGNTYLLPKEDEFSPLRDAREFGTVLNACGRMKKAGIGLSLCLGDRDEALREAEALLSEYRRALNRTIVSITSEPNRIVDTKAYHLVRGEEIVDEEMLGAICSIVAGMPRFYGKPVVARTSTRTGEMKFSARATRASPERLNLGAAIAEAARVSGGKGGGHAAAAGARVPSSRTNEFLEKFEERLLA